MCTADGRALRPEWARDYYINGSVADANAALEAEAMSSEGNPEASVPPRCRGDVGEIWEDMGEI